MLSQMFIRWLVSIVINAVALIIVDQLFTGFHIDGFGMAILASFVLSILNILVKPFLIILTLPITVFTLGLFLFVVNAITLMLTQALFGSAFEIDGFGLAIVAAIIISILNLILNRLIKDSVR